MGPAVRGCEVFGVFFVGILNSRFALFFPSALLLVGTYAKRITGWRRGNMLPGRVIVALPRQGGAARNPAQRRRLKRDAGAIRSSFGDRWHAPGSLCLPRA
jgi:hypothetical protein